jgi:hypothetical protein
LFDAFRIQFRGAGIFGERLGDSSTIYMKESQDPESESAEPGEDAIARVAVSLTGKERAVYTPIPDRRVF